MICIFLVFPKDFVWKCLVFCAQWSFVPPNLIPIPPIPTQDKKEKKKKKKEKTEEKTEEGGDDAPADEPKKAKRATSNVFALFNQAQIQEFKEVGSVVVVDSSS